MEFQKPFMHKEATSAVTYQKGKKLPVSFQYPLGNGISNLVEHNFIICTAYEKLVL